jgi:hypothetical protein
MFKLAMDSTQLVCRERSSRQTVSIVIYKLETAEIHDNYGVRDKDLLRNRCAARIVSHVFVLHRLGRSEALEFWHQDSAPSCHNINLQRSKNAKGYASL